MSRSTPQVKRQPITDRQFVMPFGKWKGETIEHLLVDDPQYLVWLHKNTEFELGHELLEEAEEGGKPNHEFKGYTRRELLKELKAECEGLSDPEFYK